MDFIVPNLRITIVTLEAAGFDVVSSGNEPDPFVTIVSDPYRLVHLSQMLMDLFEKNNIEVTPLGVEKEIGGVSIEGSYDPSDNSCCIQITGITDCMWPQTISFMGNPAPVREKWDVQ